MSIKNGDYKNKNRCGESLVRRWLPADYVDCYERRVANVAEIIPEEFLNCPSFPQSYCQEFVEASGEKSSLRQWGYCQRRVLRST